MAQTSYAIWKPPKELEEMFRNTADALKDLSPAMEKVSRIGFEEVYARLQAGGDGDWPPLATATIRRHGQHQVGVGPGGGFGPTLRRDWSKNNAVVFSRAPHAHLFEGGTQDHFSGSYGTLPFSPGDKRRGKRTSLYANRSRTDTRNAIAKRSLSGQDHEPPRRFMYFSERFIERAGETILAHVFDAFDRAA
jgi:hypothetical protein